MVALDTPIIEPSLGFTHHFNGRRILAEDLAREQRASQLLAQLTNQAIGSGVAFGLHLEVAASSATGGVAQIGAGVAVAPNGEVLVLPTDVQVDLWRPQSSSPRPSTSTFGACGPQRQRVYIPGFGLYLLTIASAAAQPAGRAQVADAVADVTPCQIDQDLRAITIRLVELALPEDVVALAAAGQLPQLRNVVAHLFLGTAGDAAGAWLDPPFTAWTTGYADSVAATCLRAGEVPLAVFAWESSSGVLFADEWAVRRRVVAPATRGLDFAPFSDLARAAAEARLQQFHAHVDDAVAIAVSDLVADQLFVAVPPAALMPAPTSSSRGVDPSIFFGDQLRGPVRVTDAERVAHLLAASLDSPAIPIASTAKVRAYAIRDHPASWVYATDALADATVTRFSSATPPSSFAASTFA